MRRHASRRLGVGSPERDSSGCSSAPQTPAPRFPCRSSASYLHQAPPPQQATCGPDLGRPHRQTAPPELPDAALCAPSLCSDFPCLSVMTRTGVFSQLKLKYTIFASFRLLACRRSRGWRPSHLRCLRLWRWQHWCRTIFRVALWWLGTAACCSRRRPPFLSQVVPARLAVRTRRVCAR
jgi:hypothetical protein